MLIRTFDKLTEITKVINKFKQEVDLRFANFHNEFLRVEKSTDQKYIMLDSKFLSEREAIESSIHKSHSSMTGLFNTFQGSIEDNIEK